MILLDTNILVYALDELSEYHAASHRCLESAIDQQIPGVLVPQVLLECYSVVTRARRGGGFLGMGELLGEMRTWRSSLPVLTVEPEALDELERLVQQTQRIGGRVYDLFLVAQMRSHGIREICTVNVRDFRLPGIQAYLPEEALARYRR